MHVTEEILYIVEIEDRYIRNDGRTADIYIYTNGKSRLTSLVWGSLWLAPTSYGLMTSSSRNLNIKGTHRGFDVRAGGDEKQKINFAWPYTGGELWPSKIFKKLGEIDHLCTIT